MCREVCLWFTVAVEHWTAPSIHRLPAEMQTASGCGFGCLLRGTRSRKADAEPANSVKKSGSRHTEEHRGAGKLSIGFFERAKDVGTFSILECYRLGGIFLFQAHNVIQRSSKCRSARENHGPFNEVLQLPDITRPRIFHEYFDGLAWDDFDPFIHPFCVFPGEVPN
jgi:hypothetical protein